jgi:hypothetical protein
MLPRPVAAVLPPGMPADDPEAAGAVAEWLLSPAGLAHGAARRYLAFLKLMYETFHAVQEGFLLLGEERDRAPRGAATSALELLYVANHLYCVDAAGVPGVLLECGTYKGFSACCLSHACGALGRKLVAVDSFRGLPEPGAGEPDHYRRADFGGSLEEVRENLATHGRPEAVELHEGYYETSLAGWDRPVALLWMDVDLYASARAVLDGVYPRLSAGAALFTHELLPEHVEAGAIVHDREPPGAIASFLRQRGREHAAAHVTGCLGVVTFADSVGRGSHRLLDALLPELRDRDHRARAAVEAIGLRPALRDLARRRLRLGRRPGG